MKKLLAVMIPFFLVSFMADFDVNASTNTSMTSTASFTVTAGDLMLTSVPELTFATDKDNQEESSSLSSIKEKKYVTSTKKSNSLTVTDYRGATYDNWSLYASFMSNNTAVIYLNTSSKSLIISQDSSKIFSSNSDSSVTEETKAEVKSMELKINDNSNQKHSKTLQGIETWTLANTASNLAS